MKASIPRETIGQAMSDGRPQLRPAMIESCGPGTVTTSPASIDASMQAAWSGSTLRIFVRSLGEFPA